MARRRRWVLGAVLLVAATVVGSDIWVSWRGAGTNYTPSNAPSAQVALVLGAAVHGGKPGTYVRGRLEAAAELVREGKVENVLVSGNAAGRSGDEVEVMGGWLRRRGIEAERDGDGLDTNMSCQHVRERGYTSVLIVTQAFHADRARLLCRRHGLTADVVVADCPGCSTFARTRNVIREMVLSRPKVVVTGG